MPKARIVVDGVVQGVGCRALVKQVARQLALKGLVRPYSVPWYHTQLGAGGAAGVGTAAASRIDRSFEFCRAPYPCH